MYLRTPPFSLPATPPSMSNAAGAPDRNQDATIYCGDLDDRVDEPLLWELFIQAGPVCTSKLVGIISLCD